MNNQLTIPCPKCKTIRHYKSLRGYTDAIIKRTSCSKCKASSRFVDITNKRFGRLVVVNRLPNIEQHVMWLCKCDCGVKKAIRGENLKGGLTQSCGCYHSEQVRGLPYEWIFKLVKRSSHHSNKSFELTYEDVLGFVKCKQCHYCHRVIEWLPHEVPKCKWAYYLDRKDNNKGYSNENCVVCCIDCNRIKGNRFTYDEMMMLLSPPLSQISADRRVI